jgi:hypothetical protein
MTFSVFQQLLSKKLLAKMTNNKEASKAADYIKNLKLNPADYPALGERLYKNTARHFAIHVYIKTNALCAQIGKTNLCYKPFNRQITV